MNIASAPGKIILFGEHAVVYGRPALAVPVMQVQAQVKADWLTDFETDKRITNKGSWHDAVLIEAPDIRLFVSLGHLLRTRPTHPLATVIINTLRALEITPLSSPHFFSEKMGGQRGVVIHISSTIPVASGLGSGAAVSVAIIRALSAHLGHSLGDEQVNQLAYEIEKLHHGTPSGIDNTVITYAKPVYFVRGQPIQTFSVAHPFAIVIADTGISAPTKESVGDVRKLWEADKNHWETVFDKVGEIVQAAKKAIESGQWEELGPLMDVNHTLLREMTVSCKKLDRLVSAAKAAGALGAKLSGGGRGGNMIALVDAGEAETVASALKAAGARNTIVTTIK